MASIRRLKKDIDYLTFAVVGDALNCVAYGKSTDDMSEIVEGIINSRNDFRMQVNAGKKVAKSERKAYYKNLCKNVMVAVDAAFSKMSESAKK